MDFAVSPKRQPKTEDMDIFEIILNKYDFVYTPL